MFLLCILYAEGDRALEIIEIRIVAAHCLADIIRQFCDRSAVDILQLDDDIQRGLLGIIRAECADTERNLRLPAEIIIELLGAVEIEAVAEQQQLGFRVNAVLFVVRNDLLAPDRS